MSSSGVVHPPASDAATDTDPRHECTVAPNTWTPPIANLKRVVHPPAVTLLQTQIPDTSVPLRPTHVDSPN
ncbi:hypothetical protein J6590_011081 [Homalodisca vitripennis]|nr:hypothetical protein J6590_011081 [Homalodisca vitripennis]